MTDPLSPNDKVSKRFPHRVYGVGTEPDPRFTLANERTFLAWIRTSLALIAAGIALEAFDLPIVHGLRLGASMLLILLGILAPVQAWFGWMGAERSLRLGHALPMPSLAGPVGGGIAVAGLMLGIGLLLW